MKMHYTLRGALGLTVTAALLSACTGDDATSDSAASATDTDATTSTTSTTNTTPGTTTATTTSTSETSGSGTETGTSGSDTDTEGTTGTTGDGVCGDGVLDLDEECDDGEQNGSDESTCGDDCTLKAAVCGNGVSEIGEECDDGNTDDGDGCAADCTTEAMNVCGDGGLGDGEACDDGNDVPNDGCENDCTISPPGECGNGEQEWDELCDDGNLENNDGCEDDCTPTPDPACQEPENYVSCDGNLAKNDPMAPFHALGLDCSDKVNEGIFVSNTQFQSPDAGAWQIAKGFGTYEEMGKLLYSAREGESFVMLSTGTIAAPNGDGVVTETENSQSNKGANGNPDDNAFLPNYTPADDQSGVLQPQWTKGGSNPGDKIWFSFKTQTPGGVKAYAIDFAFFSSEWPNFVDTTYNDLFVAWQVAEEFTGNISTIDDKPTTITALHPHWSDKPLGGLKSCANYGNAGPGFSCGEPQLAGTGFENRAGTTWVRINQPITENAELELFFFLADMGDTALASAVLLDRFRFSCEECIPADAPQCTGEVLDENCCGVVLPM
ncbi:MAG: choice-of-anchor L domain-containing protein [Nannocystaceae bacterium]